MASIRFEWDPRKAAANLEKHGISFAEAETAFYDEQAAILPDPALGGCGRPLSAPRAQCGAPGARRRALRP